MKDEEMAIFVCPDNPCLGLQIVATLPSTKRALFERMGELEGEIALWSAGLGPKPTGVILCGPKQIRGAGVERKRPKRAQRR